MWKEIKDLIAAFIYFLKWSKAGLDPKPNLGIYGRQVRTNHWVSLSALPFLLEIAIDLTTQSQKVPNITEFFGLVKKQNLVQFFF